ncbi:MAG: triose-phosphate isomerase [Patescibacteria group bacterium]|nr:triose-phosphate isomerase [Patescibacteria group bacterium]
MRKTIIANWKMNPETISVGRSLLSRSLTAVSKNKSLDFLAAVPAPFLADPAFRRQASHLAGQNVSWRQNGALTGEFSAKMIKSLGVKYSIVGHSERRECFFENEETVAMKVRACFEVGIVPILCIGESMEIRRKGLELVKIYLKDQLRQTISGLEHSLISKIIFVYEPVWAVGGKEPDDPKSSAELIDYLKSALQEFFGVEKPKVLYGGSVDGSNIRAILSQKPIDGVLVGRASVDPAEFAKIVKNAKI